MRFTGNGFELILAHKISRQYVQDTFRPFSDRRFSGRYLLLVAWFYHDFKIPICHAPAQFCRWVGAWFFVYPLCFSPHSDLGYERLAAAQSCARFFSLVAALWDFRSRPAFVHEVGT